MKKYTLLQIAFALFSLILIVSCRKNDIGKQAIPNAKNESRFFDLPSNSPDQIKAIAEAIRKQNTEKKFLKSIVEKAGYPIWDKARIVDLTAGTINGRGTEENQQIVYIPFALDSLSYVNAVLRVNLSTDTTYRLLYRTNYRKFGYDTTRPGQWNARSVFNFFASFDNSVFETKEFEILDPLIFNVSNQKPDEKLRVKIVQDNSSTSGGRVSSLSVETCITYQVCPAGTIGDPNGPPARVSTGSDPCVYFDVCTTYTYNTDGGIPTGGWDGTQAGIGGGGTSGSGWYDGSGSPCPPSRVSQLPPGGNGCGPGWQSLPPYNQTRINQLVYFLQNNPQYLTVPCDYLDQYLAVLNHHAPTEVLSKVSAASEAYLNSGNPAMVQFVDHPCYLLDIEDAQSAMINFDFFPLKINKLPTWPANSGHPTDVQMTATELFEYFRLHWNSFVDNNIATFNPYQDQIVNDYNLWNSDNPLGAFLHLNMLDNGSVVVTKYTKESDNVKMFVKTVRTPLDGLHPVSGTRTWGIQPDPSGGYMFYVSGVDRITGLIPTAISTWVERIGYPMGFKRADYLWWSLQDKMMDFIIANHGVADLYAQRDYILRPDWADVDLFLRGVIELTELKRRIGC